MKSFADYKFPFNHSGQAEGTCKIDLTESLSKKKC